MSRFHVISDLHNEFYPYSIDKKAIEYSDAIILAGDIHNPKHFVRWVKEQEIPSSKPIFYVFGNHEWYYQQITREAYGKYNLPNFRIVGKHPKNIKVFSDRIYKYIFGDAMIVGCTLWTDYIGDNKDDQLYNMHIAAKGMNDYYKISYDGKRKLTPEDILIFHQKDKQKLKTAFGDWKGKRIVITHHLPSMACITKEYESSPLNPCFASALDDIILETKADLWVYGHTHTSADFTIGNCRMICNPRGYASHRATENKKFNPQLIVKI